MKKIYTVLAIIVFSIINAQSIKGKVTYEETISNISGLHKINYNLYMNKNVGLYLINDSIKDKDSEEEPSSSKFSNFIPKSESKPSFFYRKLNDSIVIFNIKSAMRQYTVKDDSIKLDWEIHPDKKKIGNFECTRATTLYRGREITAWFTSKIPVDFGPRKFNGLPGLILEAYDKDGVFKVSATKVELNTEIESLDKLLENIDLDVEMSYEDFLNIRCDDADKLRKIIMAKMGRESTSMKTRSVGAKDNLENDYQECGD